MRNAHKLNRRTIAVAIAIAVALVAPAAQAAYANSGTTPVKATSGKSSLFDAKTLALMAAQQPLTAASQRIEAVAGSADQGLGGSEIDVPHNAITLHWHGKVPATVQTEIDHARAQGITVTVLPAAYTRVQFQAEMDRLVTRSTAEANQQHTRPLIASVQIRDDFSGIDIGVTADAADITPAFVAGTGDLSSSMPVSTHHEDLAVPSALLRQTDTPPFYGGAAIESASGECTSGWAVHDSTRHYLLTAAHCGWDNWDNYPGTSFIGRTSNITYTYDAQIIPANSDNWIYIGNSIAKTTGQGIRQVAGVLPIEKGTELCADGAFSGQQCDINVTSTGPGSYSFYVGGQWRKLALWEAKSNTSSTIEGDGDSGGPVFGVTGTDGSLMLAGGTISARATTGIGPCHGVTADRTCSTIMLFAAASDELRTLGVTLP